MEGHLHKLKQLMMLQDWDITVAINVIDVDAMTLLVYNDYKAGITINVSLSYEEQVRALIHELVHVMLRQTQQIANDNIKNDGVKQIWQREMERETERLARSYYNLYKEVDKCTR